MNIGTWTRGTRCDNSGPNCVEAKFDGTDTVTVRDSKNPDGPVLSFTSDEWRVFTAGVVAGEFAV